MLYTFRNNRFDLILTDPHRFGNHFLPAEPLSSMRPVAPTAREWVSATSEENRMAKKMIQIAPVCHII
jgi:hypothetical protein